MNFKALESKQKLRGGYYTQPDIASFLVRWVLEISPKSILEPSCGDGAFIQATSDQSPSSVAQIVACELLASEAKKAAERAVTVRGFDVSIHTTDFLKWSLPRLSKAPEFDAVLGNPPFIRYQYLDSDQQARAEGVFNHFGLPFTKHTNAWVPFIIASLAQLRPGGRLAMVVPAEILHVLHAKPLRDYLLAECSKLLLLDPRDIWFDDTLQGVMLLLAERTDHATRGSAQISVVSLKQRSSLSHRASRYFDQSDYISGDVMNGKWMLALLTSTERALLASLADHPQISPFAELAEVDVGIVTGANNFFLVPDSVVEKYALHPWAHPMFGRSGHVSGVIYDNQAHQSNRQKGLPTNFLWFRDALFSPLSASAREYIELGHAEELDRRYKCRIRTPWYTVPSVYSTPVAMLKRSHNFPRLVLNRMKAFTTDTAYRIKPKGVSASALVMSFVNSLTALTAELEGRHYGGGVLELVPSEIEKILVPHSSHKPSLLKALHQNVSNGLPPEDLLHGQDTCLLTALGISQSDSDVLLQAWARLKSRRHRK